MSDGVPAVKKHSFAWRRKLFVGLLIGPALLLILTFAYWPILSTLQYSFNSWNGFSKEMTWVGWDNYLRLLRDPYFYNALKNNLLIVAVSLLIQLPLSFVTAYTIFKVKNRWAELSKVIFYIPCILSMVMIGLLWRFIYDYQYGTLNTLLKAIHLPGLARVWLTDPQTALGAILVVVVWVYFGYHCLIHSAGINALPVTILEAAKIDGAKGWVMVGGIMLPMLSEVIRVSLIISLVGSFQFFDLIWILTGGGPFHRTDVLATYMYNRAFQAREFGYGGAIAVVILLCALGATLIQNLWQRENAKGGQANEV
ncbi:carbohydrate ABC transporter membrane protein 1 (CUT1 family) [Hydrogenispora ethanolica]|uniref:Carbohydrate ABC transporter membrane protein 1 (CUT1 family) n=1 Tax=Hydrogenispora ethanolica TaxID=1082276 RepID=A0A4R1SBV3_HYDET|nr:sugar ABC transporter permease [Hydrogenispora ethanolica]TCL77001.1 carbohydrate ABC transporter membrane protein 1 (CUT1 family) [Hydrogenispora ethanolica]